MIHQGRCARCAKTFCSREPEFPLVCGECLDWLGSQPGSGVEFKGVEVE